MSLRNLSPKELQVIYETIEHIAEEFYFRGAEDAKAGKPLENRPFSLSKESRLLIKTNLIKAVQNR